MGWGRGVGGGHRLLDKQRPKLDKLLEWARSALVMPSWDWSLTRDLSGTHAPSLPDCGVCPKGQMPRVSGWLCQEWGLARCSQHPGVLASSPAGGGACDWWPQSLLTGPCSGRARRGRGLGPSH